MREPKPEWIAALRRLEGCADADIRWNLEVGRWEFIMPRADGVPQSQFWGQYWRWEHGERVRTTPDEVTGLYPFRDLDDEAMSEALRNLTETYIGNPFDGAGTTSREVGRRIRFNRDLRQRKYKVIGETFGDMAGERAKRLRGALTLPVGIQVDANAGASA